jgi:hypothetical protein
VYITSSGEIARSAANVAVAKGVAARRATPTQSSHAQIPNKNDGASIQASDSRPFSATHLKKRVMGIE